MLKDMENKISEIERCDRNNKKELIISIDDRGKVLKFNEKCEKVAGYSRYEVLNRNFFASLIPRRYLKQWKKTLGNIKRNKLIDDFSLPLLTRNGHEIMISWTAFPLKSENGGTKSITIVGDFIDSWDDAKESYAGRAESVKVREGHENFYKIFRELEKRNQELEKINLDLEKKIKKLKEKNLKRSSNAVKSPTTLNIPIKFFIGKKKREEMEKFVKELEERSKNLHQMEDKLNKERRIIEEQKNWLIRWREKLESLEFEIENRNQDVLRREQIIHRQETSDTSRETSYVNIEIDKIDDCAFIIQRGIFKEVNNHFAELLGYDINEIVDKNLFDFICSEGLSGLEQYYLARLKGNDVSNYETVFLTKDNEKISVEITTKPTIYKNEKAEIGIVKKLIK